MLTHELTSESAEFQKSEALFHTDVTASVQCAYNMVFWWFTFPEPMDPWVISNVGDNVFVCE